MNQLKNIFKIFIKNLKHIIYLLKEKEIPKKSIYSLNFKILNYKNFSNIFSFDISIGHLTSTTTEGSKNF